MALCLRLSSGLGAGATFGSARRLAARPLQRSTRRSVAVRAEPEAPKPATEQQAQQPAEDLPPWVRREKERELAAGKSTVPWPLYLVASCLVAIAAVGSVFEYFGGNAVFGVVQPDNPLWAPILGLFAFTGLPMAGFLFFKGVNAANEAAEMQDRIDGYIK